MSWSQDIELMYTEDRVYKLAHLTKLVNRIPKCWELYMLGIQEQDLCGWKEAEPRAWHHHREERLEVNRKFSNSGRGWESTG